VRNAAEQLGSILSKLPIPGPGPLQVQQIREAASRVLKTAAAREIRVGSLRRGKLILEGPSAAQAFEWDAFGRDELLRELQAIPGLEKVQELRFRAGAWRTHDRQ